MGNNIIFKKYYPLMKRMDTDVKHMEKRLIIILCSSRLRIHNYREMSNLILNIIQCPILIIKFNNDDIANYHNYISKQIIHKINNMCTLMSDQMNVNISINKYTVITHTNSSMQLLKMINMSHTKNSVLYRKIDTIICIDPLIDYNYLKYCKTLKNINDNVKSIYDNIDVLAIFFNDNNNQTIIDLLDDIFSVECIFVNNVGSNDVHNMFINNLHENNMKKNIWFKVAHVMTTKINMK